MSDVTAVLTSCGRFGLLERTLRGFLAVERAPLARFILIEDSGDGAVREVVAAVDPGIEVVANPARIGQHASIDRAYAMVETPYVMHLEDDWAFEKGGTVAEGRAVLAARPDVSAVSGRMWGDFLYPGAPPEPELVAGVACRLVPRDAHPGWFGYAFHPGMRRLAEWRRFGPFAGYAREWDVSYAMKRAGFRMAYLAEGRYREIGRDETRADSDPAKPRGEFRPWEALRKSAKKALFEVERRLGRYSD